MKRIYDLLPVSESGGSYTLAGAASDTQGQPPRGTSTHLLHLAPHGAILPHVDNLEASGSVIIGTSLGAERILRLKEKGGEEGWDVRLPSGSLYIQR
jgi:alkylated DNA repair protein alkB family protein 7